MELFDNLEDKTTYNKCKYIVKFWEHNFKKSKGRLPSKLDIREADKHVRDAYRKYFQLKTKALEQSFLGVDGFNSDDEETIPNDKITDNNTDTKINENITKDDKTWGTHLNNITIKDNDDTNKKNCKKLELNTKFTKKLFCGSKFTKRNPLKSLSFSARSKSDNSCDNDFLSQPTNSNTTFSLQDEINDFNLCSNSNSNVKFVKSNIELSGQSINFIKTYLNNNNDDYNKSIKSFDQGWLNRITNETQKSLSTVISNDSSDDNIIDDSDDENNSLHLLKKPKIMDNIINITNVSANRQDFSNIFSSSSSSSSNKFELNQIINEDNLHKICNNDISLTIEGTLKKESILVKDEGCNNSLDPDFIPKKNVKKSNKTVTSKKNKNNYDEDNEENNIYELEYSIKPRIVAPRCKNFKKFIKEHHKSTDKNDNNENVKDLISKNSLQNKIESGTLNDNYVRIDIKKKVFVRGKKHINFTKYKKQQWKNKKKALAGPDMDMGGCDGGVLTCFECGDVGHLSRNCKKNKIDNLLPLEENYEEPCPFPTLDEAAQMANDNILNIKKSNMKLTDNDNKIDDGNSNDSEDEELLKEILKLEEHINKLDVQQFIDNTKIIEPYYNLNEDDTLIDTPNEVYETLKLFNHENFRPGQELAIMRILSGKSTLLTLSTGSGKSLCYQLPAYLYSKKQSCITLVISPLVSLMEDQIIGIPSFLKAACLHTNLSKIQREKVLQSISDGNLNILLVSPEAIVMGEKRGGFSSLLRKLPPISFVCIDEVHCVSQWSHNFRPSYLMICHVLREKLGVKTILGLTATATQATKISIIEHLQISDKENGIISDKLLPDNLNLSVSKDDRRDDALVELIESETFRLFNSIIIYCTRREECERLATYLRTVLKYHPNNNQFDNKKKRKKIHVQAEPYHAGLSASRRKSIQKSFMSGELRIVVATVAFGMGINKSDIRMVIHYNMPKNFESYVQEIGRAGRDCLPSYCHLFLDSQGRDENELRRHIYANSVDRFVIRKLLQKIFIPCSCKEQCPKHEVAFSIEETVLALDIPEENISTLLCYLELHENKYIELLSPVYTICKIISYNSGKEIRNAAKNCPPLAMALALKNKKDNKNNDDNNDNVLEFAVVDVASAMGWDSGICKHKLKNLEWLTVNEQPKRSSLNVQFSNLGFHMLAPGNLTDEQLDETLDNLFEHTKQQEKTALLQLRAVHQTLIKVAQTSFKNCVNDDINQQLKNKLKEYFNLSNPLKNISIDDNIIIDEERLINNIRGLIFMYKDNNFTGRSIARIFHGITSPNYPAIIWGRSKYWRSHIDIDFHTICKFATKEILKLKEK